MLRSSSICHLLGHLLEQCSSAFSNSIVSINSKPDDSKPEIEVKGITGDSRNVRPGFVFVAYSGEGGDGHSFIPSALEKGAVAVFGEIDQSALQGFPANVPYFQISNGRSVLAQLAAAFYQFPTRKMRVIGVTGTSGKTTTTYLIESIFRAAGAQVGVLGTVNFRFGKKVFPSTHTTPGPAELQLLLAQMRDEGCDTVVMEVSSHALKQRRVEGIFFDGMVFTNLSPEHLDYHPDMEDYFQSKALLFRDYAQDSVKNGKSPVAVVSRCPEIGILGSDEEDSSKKPEFTWVNEDFFEESDEVSTQKPISRQRLVSRCSEIGYEQRLFDELKVSSHFSEGSVVSFSGVGQLKVTLDGITGQVRGLPITSKLTGQFNAANIAAAVTLAQALGVSDSSIQKGVLELEGIPGRLQRIENDRGLHIWVDYAHKPDALEKVLKTLRTMKGQTNRLVTVFGCGGDRDRTKRPVMGKIAVENSDWVWVTSDNPRTEAPDAIIREITAGMGENRNFQIEADRRKAIFNAVQTSLSGDLILIAGKGHEDYQIIGKSKIHFDDCEVALEALAKC